MFTAYLPPMYAGGLFSFPTKKHLWWLAAVCLLLPLLWLNVRHSHPWGDDFSLYIGQAINIAEDRVFDNTTYRFIDGFSTMVPSTPVGFSILLVPVYNIFGFDISAFTMFMAVLYVLWALLSFSFYRTFFSGSTALLMLFIAFYPNFLLWLKVQVISDVPFALSLLLVCWLWQKQLWQKTWGAILIGLLIAFAIHVRSTGIVMIPAVALQLCYLRFFKSQHLPKAQTINALLVLALSAGGYLLFEFIYKPQHSYIGNSIHVMDVRNVLKVVAHNFKSHTLDYHALFCSTDSSLTTLSAIFGWAMVFFTVAGALLKWKKAFDFFDCVTALYLLLIIVYPVTSDYRYVSPVHPFLIFYLFYFLQAIAGKLRFNMGVAKLALFSLGVLVYKDHLTYLIKTTHETLPGPQEEICQETFAYIKSNIDSAEIVAFNKPRALALYTGKQTIYFNADTSAAVNFATLHSYGVRYYLYSWALSEPDYDSLVKGNSNKMVEVYKNWQFTLYKDTSGRSELKSR